MEDAHDRLLQEAESVQQRFEETLKENGMSLESLHSIADTIRQQLPRAHIHTIEQTKNALLSTRRQRPGTSQFVRPIGIRG